MLRRYTETELRAELDKEIAKRIAQREPVHPAWITHQVCRAHKAGLAEDGDEIETLESEHVAFWRFNGYAFTRKLATACINELDEEHEAEDDPEPFLEGFPHLRPQYVIRRDGVDVMVPTEKMTSAECRAKALMFERNAATLIEHARELRRYADMRDAADAAATRVTG